MINIPIPDHIAQEALECFFIQQSWSIKSTELRSREVERKSYHFHDILIWIIANEYRRQKLLPYNNQK